MDIEDLRSRARDLLGAADLCEVSDDDDALAKLTDQVVSLADEWASMKLARILAISTLVPKPIQLPPLPVINIPLLPERKFCIPLTSPLHDPRF